MDQSSSKMESNEKSTVDVIQASAASIHDTKPKHEEDQNEKQKSDGDDDDLEPLNLDSYKPPSEEILKKLLAQAEFYFSDSNVLKDKFLMKNIQESKGGFISVKLLSAFRRMQAISKDWQDLAFALRRSEKLDLNEAGNKVRRKDPLPEWDDSVYDRTVVTTNLQIPEVSVAAVKSIFGKCGSVMLVRVLQPGKNLPEDLKAFAPKHPEFATRVCAVVEFAKQEEAEKAIKQLGNRGDWKAMQVIPLRGLPNGELLDFGMDIPMKTDGVKIIKSSYKGKENMASKAIGSLESSPSSSPSTRRKKSSRRELAASGGIPIPDRHKLDAYGGHGSPCRSPGRRSPRPSSYTSSGDDYERYDNRSPAKPIPGRMQQHRGTPIGSPDMKRGIDESPLSCSPASLGTSPWIRRRALMEQADPSSSPGKNLITIIRQPRGPSGTKGFSGLRPSN